MSFNKQFEEALNSSSLTIGQAAHVLGVTRMTIHNWMGGKTEPPAKPVLTQDKILKVLEQRAKQAKRKS